ncbi:hypothetical protein [Gimesia maris]|uniref:hypothetical protein n=1 Tax=Gimesia maris TaxID=122 RepID=UPI00241D9F0F|nr:hypothetical protein [Gimesia maris]|tara:strand:+ start:32880 stop:33170 length:291 start_codon:yes stop_codon:yes gene_type:complete
MTAGLMKIAKLSVLTLVMLIAVALFQLYVSVVELSLSQDHIRQAFGKGIAACIFLTAGGTALRSPLSGLLSGILVCFFFALGYIVLWAGIPLEWLF